MHRDSTSKHTVRLPAVDTAPGLGGSPKKEIPGVPITLALCIHGSVAVQGFDVPWPFLNGFFAMVGRQKASTRFGDQESKERRAGL